MRKIRALTACAVLVLGTSVAAQPIPFIATGNFAAPNISGALPNSLSGSFSFSFELDPTIEGLQKNIPLTSLILSPSVVGSKTFDLSNTLGGVSLSFGNDFDPSIEVLLIGIGGAPDPFGGQGSTDDFQVLWVIEFDNIVASLQNDFLAEFGVNSSPGSEVRIKNSDGSDVTISDPSGQILISRQTVSEPVTIDIKPGSDPNSINPYSRGKIPVAVLTTGTFDAIQVDPLTVAFGPDGATESHGRSHVKDIDDDGDTDLILHFNTQETGIQCGDNEATLIGETFDGHAITGTDSINTVHCP